jgi:alkyl hydroperoxide reductase subunit AhpC
LADYAAHYREIGAAGADVVVVSVDSPNKSAALRHNLRLPFAILSDTGKQVIKDWGIYNPREKGGIAVPSVFILDRDRTVLYASVDSTFARIPTPDIVRILQSPGEAPPPPANAIFPAWWTLSARFAIPFAAAAADLNRAAHAVRPWKLWNFFAPRRERSRCTRE